MSHQNTNLIEALVGEYEYLYRQSPEFYHGIKLLARVLPRFVDLMAEDSMLVAEHNKKIIQSINLGKVVSNGDSSGTA